MIFSPGFFLGQIFVENVRDESVPLIGFTKITLFSPLTN